MREKKCSVWSMAGLVRGVEPVGMVNSGMQDKEKLLQKAQSFVAGSLNLLLDQVE